MTKGSLGMPTEHERIVFDAGVRILEPYRLEIVKHKDGSFWIEDRVTRLGPFQTRNAAANIIIHSKEG
jgi:hypothetical protein